MSSSSSSSPTRWGLASAGKISHDFTLALATMSDVVGSDHQVVAVAARSADSAAAFARRHNIPKSYGGDYAQLAADPDVDVVYVGVIHPGHKAVVSAMLNAGKPVLCEKPLGMNVKETREMYALAKEKKVFLMEAMWSRFLPPHIQLKKELEQSTIGDVRQMRAELGFDADSDRLVKKELGGGSVLDIGVYNVYLTSLVFKGERPLEVKAIGHLNSNDTDDSVCAVLKYSGGRSAYISFHGKAFLSNEARIYGTKGQLALASHFHCTDTLVMPDGSKREFPLAQPRPGMEFNFCNSAGMAYEARHVRECLNQGLLESPDVTHEESMLVAEILEDIRKQVGVEYPQDED